MTHLENKGNFCRKPVGTWFGPNTVAQVLRKLCLYDPRCVKRKCDTYSVFILKRLFTPLCSFTVNTHWHIVCSEDIAVHVAMDNTLVINEVDRLKTSKTWLLFEWCLSITRWERVVTSQHRMKEKKVPGNHCFYLSLWGSASVISTRSIYLA